MARGMTEHTLRDARRVDPEILLQIYAETRDDVTGWGWPEAEALSFLRGQLRAREAGYRARFPDLEDRVIEQGGVVVGRLMIQVDPEALRLVDIALLSHVRGHGLGGQIVRDLQRRAAALGSPIRLHVLEGSPARRLYARLGFEVISEGALYAEMSWAHTRT